MKHKVLIFIMALLSVSIASFAEKYTLKFSKDFFDCLTVPPDENFRYTLMYIYLPRSVVELPDYTSVTVEYSEIGIKNRQLQDMEITEYTLPVYVLDSIETNYEVEKFSYKVNKSIKINDNVALDGWILPNHTDPEYSESLHCSLNYEADGFPVKKLVKYDFHRIKDKNVFYISPFIYNPKTKTLKFATEITIDVKLKLKCNIYVGGENIIVEAESDRRQNIRIYDVSGRMVCSSAFVRNTAIDKSGFDSGVYIVNISDADGSHSRNIKIVI